MTEHFLRFEHEVRDGLHTYTARAGRTMVEHEWPGLQYLAPYPDDDPELNPAERFGISNFVSERLAVWRAVAWAVTEGLHRCASPHWVRNSAASVLGVERSAVRLVRWEYDADADGGPGFVAAASGVQISPPPDQWELDHRDFAGLFPLASFADLTLLDSVVQHEIRAQVTVFGLHRGRFEEVAAALDDQDRPPPAALLRPGEMMVSLATVRDEWFTDWDNILTVMTPTATSTVDRVAAHYATAYRRYLDAMPALRTMADFNPAAERLLALP
ncbi:hypothetical protein ACFO1B_02325 [Dactylosporangium siamense]|uniref:Uncharacterized protein n=1 Tax=Dactylosporangium siamense TaxID=685454 RepID=A0A919UAG7_9ACTN|nr:hypothetical protein [Dactylosporangium siamense]GIG48504.1 hypothetical protein Dsi01nite_065450 [Dactylosporangium siamense]